MTDQVKVALGIGAGDAIGAAFARRFAKGGYRVAMARRDPTKSDALVQEINAGGGDIFRVHQQTLDTNVTIDSDENALCAGPLTVASTKVLTINGNLVIA